MAKFRITKEVEWDAAHRLSKHKGLCANVHGHRYKAAFTLEADKLNDDDMVIDFGPVKNAVKTWIDANWDHATILTRDDEALVNELRDCDFRVWTTQRRVDPTAEVMAAILGTLDWDLPKGVRLHSVKVWETPTASAEYIL